MIQLLLACSIHPSILVALCGSHIYKRLCIDVLSNHLLTVLCYGVWQTPILPQHLQCILYFCGIPVEIT